MEINITIKIEDGEVVSTKVKTIDSKTEETKKSYGCSQYARFFDSNCNGWSKEPKFNLLFLRQQENYATDLLKSRKYLFLNDVYDLLGIPRSKEGQVVGWIYDEKNPIGDNKVDFGIFDVSNPKFANGLNEKFILLDFNVDGTILDKI